MSANHLPAKEFLHASSPSLPYDRASDHDDEVGEDTVVIRSSNPDPNYGIRAISSTKLWSELEETHQKCLGTDLGQWLGTILTDSMRYPPVIFYISISHSL